MYVYVVVESRHLPPHKKGQQPNRGAKEKDVYDESTCVSLMRVADMDPAQILL